MNSLGDNGSNHGGALVKAASGTTEVGFYVTNWCVAVTRVTHRFSENLGTNGKGVIVLNNYNNNNNMYLIRIVL